MAQKKVEIPIFLNLNENGKWYFELDPMNEEFAIQNSIDFWLKDPDAKGLELFCTITNKYLERSPKQLGYLYAEIYPKFFIYMRNNGMEAIDEILKNSLKLHPDIMFCNEVYDVFTGETRLFPKSCAVNHASKEDVTEFIDRLIRLGDVFDIHIEDPEEYKKRKGISSDQWQQGFRK